MRRNKLGIAAPAVLAFVLWGVIVPTRAAEQDPWADKIREAVARLAGDSALERSAGEVALYALPPAAFHGIEAAGQQPGLRDDVRAKIREVVERQRVGYSARMRQDRKWEAEWKWNVTTATDAYKQVGKHNPKWDEPALEGIRLFVSRVGHGGTPVKARAKIEEAISNGCDDPFILYLESQLLLNDSNADRGDVDSMYRQAAEGMAASRYPASRKCFALYRYVLFKFDLENRRAGFQGAPSPELNQLLVRLGHAGEDAWPQAMAEPGLPELFVRDLWQLSTNMARTAHADVKKMFDEAYPPIEKSQPPAVALAIKGDFFVSYAWQARGGGYANTVTPEGAKLMQERLAEARQALTRAWEADPTSSAVCDSMLEVTLGEGGDRAEMEKWFKRAMEANPDDRSACNHKLYYLEPKWYGSPKDMLEFAHQCYATKDWYGNLPFVLVDAHKSLAAYFQDPRQYYRNAAVWNDLRSVYEPYLAFQPDNDYLRSVYAYFACMSGHWEEANKQFAVLGKKADPGAFGGAGTMNQLRAEAAAQAGPATP